MLLSGVRSHSISVVEAKGWTPRTEFNGYKVHLPVLVAKTDLTEMDWFIADEDLLLPSYDSHFREGVWVAKSEDD